MSMLKKPQTVEAVVFFNERGICKQMLYSEFEAILDGVVGLPEFADCQMRLTYLMITPRLSRLRRRGPCRYRLEPAAAATGRARRSWSRPWRRPHSPGLPQPVPGVLAPDAPVGPVPEFRSQ